MYFLRFISAGQAAASNTFAFAGFVLARCTCMRNCVQVSFATLETGRNLGQKSSCSGLWGRYWGQNKRRDATIPQATARCDSSQISSELVFFKWRIPSVLSSASFSRYSTSCCYFIYLFIFIYLVQEEMKKEFVDITLPAQLQKLETILKDHNEGKGFFLGDKVGGENFSQYEGYSVSPKHLLPLVPLTKKVIINPGFSAGHNHGQSRQGKISHLARRCSQ